MTHKSKIQPTERFLAHGLMLLEQVLGARAFAWLCGGLKRRLLVRLTDRLKGASPPRPLAVDHRVDLTPELFRREYFSRSLPVVFSGAAREWPCCKKWNLDFFSIAHGGSDLLLVDAPGLTTREKRDDYQFLTVRELIANIKGGGEKYLRFSPLLHDNPQLTEDLDMKWLSAMRGGKTFGNTYYMFMGGKGQKTFLHADQPCNLYVQIHGEKRWTFYPVEDSVCLYPEITNTAYVKSPVDIDRPDVERYPLFPHAQSYEVHLKPGDVMYVPPHLWHQVENLSDSIAVGYRFSSLTAALRSSVVFSLIRLLSTNPPVWKTAGYGKVDTNLIWAHSGGKINDVLAEKKKRESTRRSHEELTP